MLGCRKAWAGWVEVPRAEQREGSGKTPGVSTGQLRAIGQDRDPSEEQALGQGVSGWVRGGPDGAQAREPPPDKTSDHSSARTRARGVERLSPPERREGPGEADAPHDGLLSSADSGREQSSSLFYRRGN